MPLCRRKRVLVTEPSPALLDAARYDPNKHVFYLRQTGEIFDNYESYTARMSFYKLKQFQCEVTGKSGLDYFQALESELYEAKTLHQRFPEPLKGPVLKAVQFQVMGRLDHLVEAVYERYKDRYFRDELVTVDLRGERYTARILEAHPARPDPVAPHASTSASASESPLSPVSDDSQEPIHEIASNLKVSVKDTVEQDDPAMYMYKVRLLKKEKLDKGKSNPAAASKQAADGNVNKTLDVRASSLSRDRLAFSKSILRRFLRDCLDRDAAVASPWTVKPAIAHKYNVSSIMPEEIRKGVESIKNKEIEKRKKVWEEKEGPPTKKQKKAAEKAAAQAAALAAAEAERARAALMSVADREREAREKEEQAAREKAEAERLAAEKKKKKPLRYPTEDLDVRIGDKEKKAGMKLKKPAPNKAIVPDGWDMKTYEMFLMAWNFLNVYGHPLHLSPFTLDDFEQAIRHNDPDHPCPLLSEIHSTLVYNLRTVPIWRHTAVLSLMKLQDEDTEEERDGHLGVPIDRLTTAMADIGNNWERVPLRFSEGREGWEDALVGCLKDHAHTDNFPSLRLILTRLLFEEPEDSQEEASPSSPHERYYSLPSRDRVDILSFMCNTAISSKAIHAHMESCEEQLTSLRKERIEVNRTKKQYVEEMDRLVGVSKEKQAEEEGAVHDSELSDAPHSDGGSQTPSGGPAGRAKNKYRALASERLKAKQEERDRKEALAEHRRLDEEVNKLERRLEGIEREFRRYLGGVRVKPLGRDRFYNRVWWFDGVGSASLVANGGNVQYGTGRIFIQGPSEFDWEVLERREDDDVLLEERRIEEEGEEGMLGVGEWAAYTEPEEIDAFVAWLNPKGVRELQLKNAFTKWWPHIAPGMRKRLADLNSTVETKPVPEARRSSRRTAGADVTKEPYMMWTNRRAINNS